MANQVTVRLPPDLARALKAAAAKNRCTRSKIMRAALQAYLVRRRRESGRAYYQIRHLIGAFDTGIPDLAERHSDHVYAGAAGDRGPKKKSIT